jgi:sugar/nucleoside kinase (ribokinase family)
VAAPTFVVVGHVVRDIVPQGWRLGGTATYAATQAQRLGLTVGVATHVGPEIELGDALPGALIAGSPSPESTTFQNVYEGGRRRQSVLSRAEPMSKDDIPKEWRSAPLALLGPVCGEVPAGLGREFSGPLVAAAAQGWLRRVDKRRRVRTWAWDGPPFWAGCSVLFVSDEDLGERREQLARWCAEVPIVVLTRNRRGARVHAEGGWRKIAAFPAQEIDPTGAGDVFAAAFLARYHETDDMAETMRFASAASACSIEASGVAGIADRATIEGRMAQHAEVVLR